MNKKITIKITAMLMIGLLMSGCIETIKYGEHSVQVTAVEEKGLIWITPSVYVKSDISSSQEEIYCVDNLAIIPQLREAAQSRSKITIQYRNELIVAPWRCYSMSGRITGIK